MTRFVALPVGTGAAGTAGATGAGGIAGAAICTPVACSTRSVIAAAACVPDAVTASPVTTTPSTAAAPVARRARDRRVFVNIFNLPFRSVMVCR